MMQKREWQELIPFYLSQRLSPDETRRFEAFMRQCGEECRREVDDWRLIASAVWAEADSSARQLPPLSPELYNKLTYRRNQPPATVVDAPHPSYAASAYTTPYPTQKRRRSGFALPMTLVAGFVLSFVFGGILVFAALNGMNTPITPFTATQPANIVADAPTHNASAMSAVASPTATLTDVLDSNSNTGTFITHTPQPTPTTLPTQTSVVPMPQFIPSNTPMPTRTPDAPPPLPDYLRVPTQSPPTQSNGIGRGGAGDNIPPELGAMSVPGSLTRGEADCTAVNLTGKPLVTYIRANYQSVVAFEIPASAAYRTSVVSDEGWHQVIHPTTYQRGWLPPEYVVLRGAACDALRIATPTSEPTPIDISSTDKTSAVVSAPFADVRAGAGTPFNVIRVAERGEQFILIGLHNDGSTVWAQVRLDGGQIGWILSRALELR